MIMNDFRNIKNELETKMESLREISNSLKMYRVNEKISEIIDCIPNIIMITSWGKIVWDF